MPDLLTVSRAARLIGVTRGVLQKKIKAGELIAFEGMVKISDLHRVFPKIDIENDAILKRITRIRDNAYSKRISGRILPDAEVLAARLQELGKELVESQGQMNFYKSLVRGLDKKLTEMGQGSSELRVAATEIKSWLGVEVEQGLHQANLPPSLLAHDSLLRLMSAHVLLQPSGHDYFVEGNDSLLEAALRAGLSPAYGCSDGSCGQCKATLISGQTKAIEGHPQKCLNISDNQILLCCNIAVTDLVLGLSEARDPRDIAEQKVVARVKQRIKLHDDILFLHLRTLAPQRLRFKSGQSVLLKNTQGASAEYPVASCPCDGQNLQFHIHRRSDEAFSADLFNGLEEGVEFSVQGPTGDFVLKEDSNRDIVFIAAQTGFAPIKSLIEHAMALGVAQSMRLYWIASCGGGHYMGNLCRSWSDALDGFQYMPLDSENEESVNRVVDDADEFRESEIYIAGPGKVVGHLIDGLREAGIPRDHLVSCHVKC